MSVALFPGARRFEPEDPETLALLDCSDLGNAFRLKARAQGQLLFDPSRGWLGYTGTHWSAEDGQRRATELAHQVSVGLYREAEACEAKAAREPDAQDRWTRRARELRRWALDSGNAGRTKALLSQAQAYLQVRGEVFDQNPLVLNTPTATLTANRESGDGWEVRESKHDAEQRLARITQVAFDVRARCPTWEAHLEACLPDPDVRRYLQTALGYALTGSQEEQVWFCLQGKGGDGKSTTMGVVRQLLGSYAIAADVRSFLDTGNRSGSEASPDLARFRGDVRLVSTGEPPLNSVLNDALLKSFTGGTLVARELHGQLQEFTPRGKLFLECNARPRIKGGDDGIWRRTVVIPWSVQIPKHLQDRGVERRLLAEGAGILNWLIEGLGFWLGTGLVMPDAVRTATSDYRAGSNPFADWFQEKLRPDPAGANKISAKRLYASFKEWCDEQGHEPMSQTAFGRALGDRQVRRCGKDGEGNVLRQGARWASLAEQAAAETGGTP